MLKRLLILGLITPLLTACFDSKEKIQACIQPYQDKVDALNIPALKFNEEEDSLLYDFMLAQAKKPSSFVTRLALKVPVSSELEQSIFSRIDQVVAANAEALRNMNTAMIECTRGDSDLRIEMRNSIQMKRFDIIKDGHEAAVSMIEYDKVIDEKIAEFSMRDTETVLSDVSLLSRDYDRIYTSHPRLTRNQNDEGRDAIQYLEGKLRKQQ